VRSCRSDATSALVSYAEWGTLEPGERELTAGTTTHPMSGIRWESRFLRRCSPLERLRFGKGPPPRVLVLSIFCSPIGALRSRYAQFFAPSC
jgi:hypothetical protein